MPDELRKQRRLAAIMFTDMVGYSALSQKNEALALDLLDEHRRLLREVFARHEGREIEAIGDGFFVEYPSALAAARCAAEIQRLLHERNVGHGPERKVCIRIGLHLGDVVAQGEHVHGDGVNIAARIERVAEPGGICLSEDVARQIQNKLEFPVRKLGRADLKNIDLPVDIYRIVLPWQTPRGLARGRLAFNLQRRQTRRALIVLSILAVAAAVAGGYGWQRSGVPQITNNRLAVLPFVSLSADQTDEYFADGITEELITRLSHVAGLEVIARTSVMSYKDTKKKIADIGQELRVGTVLEGSVRKDRDKLRITAQLIRVDNEAHLWADSYDQDAKDAFAIQKSIADRVAQALAAKLGTAASVANEPRGTLSSEAYNSYLRGRFHTNKSNLEGLIEGIHQFQDAIRLDPSFALAYVGLAEAYVQLPIQLEFDQANYDVHARNAYPNARHAALKAIELDPSVAEAHTVLGAVKTFYDYDWAGAEAAFKRALELNPNSSNTYWWYAWHQMFLRNFDEGVSQMRRAVELDPVSIAKNMDLGWAYQFPGRWDESIDQLRRTLEMDRTNLGVIIASAWAYFGKRMYKEAEVAFLKEAEAIGDDALVDLACFYGVTGETSRALSALEKFERRARVHPQPGFSGAVTYLGLATRDKRYRAEMYRWLHKGFEERSFYLVHTSNQWWLPFHSDPEWAAFRRRMGLPS